MASKDQPTILFTGGTGFVGRNVLPILRQNFGVLSPGRAELDLRDSGAVSEYVQDHGVTHIIHCANPNPAKNAADQEGQMFADSLNSFLNVFASRESVNRILYLGSGAEYDKRLDVASIREEDAMRSVPQDQYGRAKYAMNALTRESSNVYNLRIFGCYGPTDHYSKFITHCVRSVLVGRDITIRQDCYFDYLHVSDLGKVMCHFIMCEPRWHDYNVASGKRVLLSQIAREVLDVMDSGLGVHVLANGLNREYTCNVDRMKAEIGPLYEEFKTLREGIAIQVEYERGCRQEWEPLDQI